MKYGLLLSILLSLSLQAVTLKEVIDRAVNTNPSLESISERIEASASMSEASGRFANPELSYIQNSLDPSEPMSQKILTLKQKLFYFGKRDAEEEVSQADEALMQERLAQAKVDLVYAIKQQAYTIWELQELYKSIHTYVDLTRQNIELFESYTSTTDNQHMGIMSAELTRSDLRIQESKLKAQIASAYTRLSYLAAFEVEDLQLDLAVWDLPEDDRLKETLENNRALAVKQKEVDKQHLLVQKAALNNYPDLTLLAGYSYRENFDDYWSVGVGMSLPLYGKEDHLEEAARKKALSAEHMKEDLRMDVKMQFKSTYAQMKSAYEIYHIIEDEALPQIEHMFELTSSSIATGGDLFKYIDLLVKKLKLEQKRIRAVANYSRADARIAALSGEVE